MEEKIEKVIKDYAHDFRHNSMNELELAKMLRHFSFDILEAIKKSDKE